MGIPATIIGGVWGVSVVCGQRAPPPPLFKSASPRKLPLPHRRREPAALVGAARRAARRSAARHPGARARALPAAAEP